MVAQGPSRFKVANLEAIQKSANERALEARAAAQRASDEAILARKFPNEAADEKKGLCKSLWRGRSGSLTARSLTVGDAASLRKYDENGCNGVEWRPSNGGRKSRKLGTTFNRCVKSVRKTVKTRKGSTKESAAIAICTTSVLYPRGRTMKRYRKGRLVTQRRRVR